MNRKTFLRTLAARCLRMANPAATLWEMLTDPQPESDAACAVDALYRDAMRLGIDPASTAPNHLRAIVAAHREDLGRQEEIPKGKEGTSSEAIVW